MPERDDIANPLPIDIAAAPSAVHTLIAATRVATPSEGPGTVIGPYKILQLIGEGGFGSVFMAQQDKPVHRRVALKIIKLGMDTRQVVARFEQERQALAVMNHANIAKVFDAGATELGRPYFVMELVTGEPITDYCDKNSLAISERLELFAQVCQAVQHAHTKGVIHRDIKPSNILVSIQDGRPQAKVIDFGIAKATAARLTEKTLFTEHRSLIGTPEYMSPEQAEGSMDIDTRTDVYSLGVLLYELLTGATPFDTEELRSAAYGEMQRIIREVDPPNPSTRLSQNTATIGNVAASRRLEPRRLSSIIRGELDWIVMKALEKDRQRRYETANDLALDIQRYLGGDAVLAAPPSAAYRLKKFVRRNAALVSSGAAVAAALLIGLIAFAWQANVANAQRDRAVLAERDAIARQQEAQQARAAAEDQTRLAEAQATLALNTIQQLIVSTAQLQAPGTSDYKKSVLDIALGSVGKVSENYEKSTSKEATTAAIHNELGRLFLRLGKSDQAFEQFERLLAIAQERVKIKEYSDPSRMNLANAHIAVAEVGTSAGRDLKVVLEHYLEALRLWQDIADHPKDDGFMLERTRVADGVAEANQRVGITYSRLGDMPAASRYFLAALDVREKALQADPSNVTLRKNIAFSCLAVAQSSFRLGDRDQARRMHDRALEIRQKLYDENATSDARKELSDAHYMQGEFELRTGDTEHALPDLERSRELRQQLVDSDPLIVDWQRALAGSHFMLGRLADRQGDAATASAHFAAVLVIRERLAALDPSNERYQAELMLILPRVGKVAEAVAIANRLAAGTTLDNERRLDLARCHVQCAGATPPEQVDAASVYRREGLQMLRGAIANGYTDRVQLQTDPDLAPLQNDPDFAALLNQLSQ